ncbi:MAG: NADPH-dependent curcumin reductase CurA [Halioglobus sp.]|jgi:NADPH-dependent curcumin reductase CurA
MSLINRKVVLARRPDGLPLQDDFAVIDEPVGPIEAGEALIKVEHLSIDAFIGTTLDHDGHHGQVGAGEPVMALGTGTVIESLREDLAVGDSVFGGMGAQLYNRSSSKDLRVLVNGEAPARSYLGLLGMTTGLTAYAGMVLVGNVAEGDTVAVSAAAGAVGTVACQIAKIKGAKVIGIAGGPEKCAFLEEIGCDGTIDYKNSDVAEQLELLAPKGLNLFFDNVGGSILDAALDNLAKEARVVICGAISQYSDLKSVQGPSLYLRIAETNSSMRGFTVDHYMSEFPAMEADLARWAATGQLTLPEHIENGIDDFPKALSILYRGGHRGKLLVAV